MGTTAILLITVMLFLWGVLSGRLERADLTAPIIFVAVGGLFAATGLVDAPSLAQTLKPLVELTLVWVLFSDAAGVAFGQVRRDSGRIVRLLGIGLPLTVVAGWALAFGCSRARASGSPCWWPPPSLPPTPLWGSRLS